MLPLTGDEKTSIVDLPFEFPYYGSTYDEVQVSTNGHVRFVKSTDAGSVNTELPDPDNPNGVVAAFWDDLRDQAGDVGDPDERRQRRVHDRVRRREVLRRSPDRSTSR